MTPKHYGPRLLTAGEVASMFGVDAKTVTRWAKAGKLPAPVKTLGGHRRWYEGDIRPLLSGGTTIAADPEDAPEAGRIVKLQTPWWDE